MNGSLKTPERAQVNLAFQALELQRLTSIDLREVPEHARILTIDWREESAAKPLH